MTDQDFEQQIEAAMQEIQGEMTGEFWHDIRTILRDERDIVLEYDRQAIESIKEVNEEIDCQIKDILELAKPETEAQFWRELHTLRHNLDVADEAVGDIRQIYSNARCWLRPYIMGTLLGIGEQVELSK